VGEKIDNFSIYAMDVGSQSDVCGNTLYSYYNGIYIFIYEGINYALDPSC